VFSKADTAARSEISNRVRQAAQTPGNNPYNDPKVTRGETLKLFKQKALEFGADPAEVNKRVKEQQDRYDQQDQDYSQALKEANKRVKKDPKLKAQMSQWLKQKYPDYNQQVDKDLKSGGSSGMPEASAQPDKGGGGPVGALLKMFSGGR
jgi:hypothetical protein